MKMSMESGMERSIVSPEMESNPAVAALRDMETKKTLSIVISFLSMFMPVTLSKRIVGIILLASGMGTLASCGHGLFLRQNCQDDTNKVYILNGASE